MKICKQCLINQELEQFYDHIKYKDKKRPICKKCFKANKSLYQKINPNSTKYVRDFFLKNKNKKEYKIKKSSYQKSWRDSFKEKSGHSYTSEQRLRSIDFRLKFNIRKRLYESLKKKRWNKNNTFNQYIGCTLSELRIYIESKFQPGMTWDNWSLKGWHLDHIIPLASAKTDKEMYKLCHFSNLQPLWAKDNLQKSDKII